jgi:hypothetical protein
MIRRAVFISNGVVLILTVASFWMLRGVVDHFSIEERRILLRLDKDVVGSEIGLWLRGRAYVQRKVWALGALHLHYALGLQARLEAYIQLIVACVNLGRYDLARHTLARARHFSPGAPELDEVEMLLTESPKMRT